MSAGIQRDNYIANLQEAIAQKADDTGLNTHQAFNRVAVEWLGYEPDDERFADGAGDRGVDFWYASDTGFDIVQVKMHEPGVDGKLDLSPFDKGGILDLYRVKEYLLDEGPPIEGNASLQALRGRWDDAIATRRLADEAQAIAVSLSLVVAGDGLTQPAEDEFRVFRSSLDKAHQVGGVGVEFAANLYDIDALIAGRWREDNREWKDSNGNKRDWVELHPEGDQWRVSSRSAIMYCRAVDLVQAFQQFGYQIFEPNVRCNITKSKVNAAIAESARHPASRKEFKFLNNGLTIICKGYSKPTENRLSFRVTQPGVVNGLQTVIALHGAYSKLDQGDKKHFEEHCFLLVRLLQEDAVRDVNRVVRATNTQNPMQARNLLSNNPEQADFENLFADLGWFFERKQGAWDAFAADPGRWRSLKKNRSRADFQVASGAGRPRVRRLDNEVLAQTWLAFIGFSDEAVHQKRYLFEDEKWYNMIFLHRTPCHAAEHNHDAEKVSREMRSGAPNPRMMLASYLAREFARAMAPTMKENRDDALARLGVDGGLSSKEETDRALLGDEGYLLGQVLNGMSFVFVEFLGYLAFQAAGENVHDAGGRLLQKDPSFRALCRTFDLEGVTKRVAAEELGDTDVLGVTWFVFRHVVGEMLSGAWKDAYLTARNRTRFNHSRDTRALIRERAENFDRYLQKKPWGELWATPIQPPDGLIGHVQRVLVA